MEVDAKAIQKRRRLKRGSLAVVVTACAIGLMVLLYVVIAEQGWRIDLTSNRSFSLSGQTVEVIKGLEGPVTIRAFFSPLGDMDQVFIRRKVDDVLQEYAKRSKKIDYKLVDPDVDLQEALAFAVRQKGTIVFQAKNGRKDIYQSVLFNYPSLAENSVPVFVGESLFTNAILNVTHGDPAQVCFLKGHGERQTDSAEADGLLNLYQILEGENANDTIDSPLSISQCIAFIGGNARVF